MPETKPGTGALQREMDGVALTVLYVRRDGASDRVLSLLRRRGFPITGVTLEHSHRPEVGRMTVTLARSEAVEQVRRHLLKLPDVLQVGDGSHARSYALFRIESLPEDRHEVLTALGSAGACVIDESASSVVAEATGTPDQIDALFTRLARFTIAEAARTPAMALHTPSADPQPQGET